MKTPHDRQVNAVNGEDDLFDDDFVHEEGTSSEYSPTFEAELIEFLSHDDKAQNTGRQLRMEAKQHLERATLVALGNAYMRASCFRDRISTRTPMPASDLIVTGDNINIAMASVMWMVTSDRREILTFVKLILFAWQKQIAPSELAGFLLDHGGIEGSMAAAKEEIGTLQWC